jgi:hypothetical protein
MLMLFVKLDVPNSMPRLISLRAAEGEDAMTILSLSEYGYNKML